MGLTEQMKLVFDAIVGFVGRHGATPSLESLAGELGCGKSNAERFVAALHERGHITRSARGAIALGSGGVSVVIPADIAAKLAQFCAKNNECISAVVADAVVLHLDSLDRVDP